MFQIETRNPHFHEEKGDEHLREMLHHGLSTIYHSPLCGRETKEMVLKELELHRALGINKEIAKPHLNTPPREGNIEGFRKFIGENLGFYSVLENQ